jgi:hypothetical protein
MDTCIGLKVVEQSLEKISACSRWLADAHLINRSALTELELTNCNASQPPASEGEMDKFVRSRNTGSTRASSWRRGQRTKFSDRGKEPGPPTNSQVSKSLPPSVDRTGTPLASIYVHQITLETLLDDEKPAIRDCQYVASYNWLDKKTPTILVPGTTIYSSAPQTLTVKLI